MRRDNWFVVAGFVIGLFLECGCSKVPEASNGGADTSPKPGDPRKPITKEQSPAKKEMLSGNSSEALTDSFMPSKPGMAIQYVIIDAARRDLGEKVQYTQKPDGIVERLQVAYGRREGSEYVWGPAKNNKPLINRRRTKDGFIETSSSSKGDDDWWPVIKLGAKPGDTWEYKDSLGVDRYVFERFATHTLKRNNKEYRTAVISCLSNRLYTESTYAEGLGLVKYQVWRNKGGSLLTEWICGFDIEPTRELTPGEKLALE